MKRKSGNLRFRFASLLILVALGLVLIRIFSLGILKHDFYTALAQGQHQLLTELVPNRGTIFIGEKGNIYQPLATNRNYQNVYLVPKEVEDKNVAAEQLSSLLGIPREDILKKLEKTDDPYEPLENKLTDEVADKIKDLKLKGVYLSAEGWRWYPQDTMACHALGFVGIRETQKIGLYGLEGYYEKELAGTNGLLESERDAAGRWLLLDDYNLTPAEDGVDLYLTLDQNIQYIIEQKLKALVEKWGAASGSIIVSEPKTGAIKAMASLPDFNPNEYGKVEDINDFLNPSTQEVYEPGSIFKPITMAAALDSGKVTPETTFIDTGSATIGSYVIQNAGNRSYGLSTMTKVLEKSINTGVVFAERQIGGEVFKNYIEAFGFDEPTGVDLVGEVGGNLSNIRENREINFATAAFGQGIAVTPLQMVAAISAIANEGKMMKPYLVEKIVDKNGQEKVTEPQVIRQPISAQTASKLTAMLVSVVRNGYDKIKIPNYFIAGKTGTAQIPSEDKRGYSDETIHSFVGYAPAYNPKFFIFIKMDKPHGINYASDSLAPTFAEITQYLLNYYEIPPEQ